MSDTHIIDLDTDEMLNRNERAFRKLRALVSAMKAVERAEDRILSKTGRGQGVGSAEGHPAATPTDRHGRM